MRRIHPVFIALIIVVIILVLYVLIAKPVLVLPTVIVPPQQISSITAYQQQLNINQLDVRIRTNGNVLLLADGHELGYVSYDPVTFRHALNLAAKVSLNPGYLRVITLVPFVFPDLVMNAALTSQILYFSLPIEMTVRFLRG